MGNQREKTVANKRRAKRQNNDIQNITCKTKDRVTRTTLKTGGELGVPKDKSCSFSTHPEAIK